ncbi:CHAT domain-containing protein [Bradyrhizobium sp. Ec3.3]|uniref:CHAT domain-containing protein n=1 Tax=Bradyrhizobium sp. Ec3.3 TaxID=189753 RepID=UPI0018DE7516|nr:CHAT domain-containing protein [Bradyrhizobium sp. Ec3.3]
MDLKVERLREALDAERIEIEEGSPQRDLPEPGILGMRRRGRGTGKSGRRRTASHENPRGHDFGPIANPLVDAPAPDLVERTPHLELEEAGSLREGSRFFAKVYLDELAPSEGESSEPIKAVAGTRIEMTLATSDHFVLEERATTSFKLDVSTDRLDIGRFALTVVDKPDKVTGQPFIAAIFYVNSRPCGRVTRTVSISGVTTKASGAIPPSEPPQPDPWAVTPAPPPGCIEVSGTEAETPDLVVTIVAADANDGRSYLCSVQTRHLEEFRERQTCPWNLPNVTRDLIAGFMKKFTAQPDGTALIAELKGAGNVLFEGSPRLFQKAFWDLIDAGIAIKTIAIVTAEPYVPWELMIPTRWKNGTDYEERPALGVEFQVGRWTDTRVIAPSSKIQLRDCFVVAPAYPGSCKLAFSDNEAAMVLARYSGDKIEPADFATIQSRLGTEARTLVHFICHGDDDGSGIQTIALEGGRTLSSTALLGMSGLAKLFRAKRPVVFLNACKVGQTVPSLVGLGGFVASFIKLGATAVIAPLWSVEDSVANKVATSFYEALKNTPEMPLAKIFSAIRAEAYKDGSGRDTYAAYCFYGDPFATVSR